MHVVIDLTWSSGFHCHMFVSVASIVVAVVMACVCRCDFTPFLVQGCFIKF